MVFIGTVSGFAFALFAKISLFSLLSESLPDYSRFPIIISKYRQKSSQTDILSPAYAHIEHICLQLLCEAGLALSSLRLSLLSS